MNKRTREWKRRFDRTLREAAGGTDWHQGEDGRRLYGQWVGEYSPNENNARRAGLIGGGILGGMGGAVAGATLHGLSPLRRAGAVGGLGAAGAIMGGAALGRAGAQLARLSDWGSGRRRRVFAVDYDDPRNWSNQPRRRQQEAGEDQEPGRDWRQPGAAAGAGLGAVAGGAASYPRVNRAFQKAVQLSDKHFQRRLKALKPNPEIVRNWADLPGFMKRNWERPGNVAYAVNQNFRPRAERIANIARKRAFRFGGLGAVAGGLAGYGAGYGLSRRSPAQMAQQQYFSEPPYQEQLMQAFPEKRRQQEAGEDEGPDWIRGEGGRRLYGQWARQYSPNEGNARRAGQIGGGVLGGMGGAVAGATLHGLSPLRRAGAVGGLGAAGAIMGGAALGRAGAQLARLSDWGSGRMRRAFAVDYDDPRNWSNQPRRRQQEAGNSHFADCDRDHEGRCLPAGGGQARNAGRRRRISKRTHETLKALAPLGAPAAWLARKTSGVVGDRFEHTRIVRAVRKRQAAARRDALSRG